jgi:hypothetical protein
MVNGMLLSAKWLGVICIGVVLLGAMTVWGLRITTISTESKQDGSGIAVEYPFVLSILTEKETYSCNETVKMMIILKYIEEGNTTITFPTRPNPNQFWFWQVYDENDQLVFYHKAVGSMLMTEDVVLSAGASVNQNCTWDQKNTDSEKQVSAGIYYLTAWVGFAHNGTEIALKPQKKITIVS